MGIVIFLLKKMSHRSHRRKSIGERWVRNRSQSGTVKFFASDGDGMGLLSPGESGAVVSRTGKSSKRLSIGGFNGQSGRQRRSGRIAAGAVASNEFDVRDVATAESRVLILDSTCTLISSSAKGGKHKFSKYQIRSFRVNRKDKTLELSVNADATLKSEDIEVYSFICAEAKAAFKLLCSMLRVCISEDGDDQGETWGVPLLFDDDDKEGSSKFTAVVLSTTKDGKLGKHTFAAKDISRNNIPIEIEIGKHGIAVLNGAGGSAAEKRKEFAYERVVNFQANRKKHLFVFVYDNNGAKEDHEYETLEAHKIFAYAAAHVRFIAEDRALEKVKEEEKSDSKAIEEDFKPRKAGTKKKKAAAAIAEE